MHTTYVSPIIIRQNTQQQQKLLDTSSEEYINSKTEINSPKDDSSYELDSNTYIEDNEVTGTATRNDSCSNTINGNENPNDSNKNEKNLLQQNKNLDTT